MIGATQPPRTFAAWLAIAFAWASACACAFTVTGCAAPSPSPPPQRPAAPEVPRPDRAPRGASVTIVPPQPIQDPDAAPSILRPRADAADDEIARVGDLVLRKHDLFDRLRETEPEFVRKWIDYLVMDALLADEAERYSIAPDVAAVDARLDAEIAVLRKRVVEELSPQATFDDYLQRRFDMDFAEYRRWQRSNRMRDWYRQAVVHYLTLREDRVQIRMLSTTDGELAKDLARRVRDGADFATLARRHSEDESRKDGGLLPQFRRGTDHPVVAVAFTLEPGQVSDVLPVERDGVTRYYLVVCLQRFEGRDVPFADVRSEIEDAIERGPLPEAEFEATFVQLLARRR